jgi:hypothetical protein
MKLTRASSYALQALVHLALLALLAPPAVAGPPEGVSGRMNLDDAAGACGSTGRQPARRSAPGG